MTNYRLLTVIGSLAYVAVGVSSPLLTLFLESLGASYIQISLVLTSFVLTLLGCNYLWGRLSDRLGRRKPFVVAGLLGLALVYAWLGHVPTLAAAWATRLLEGAALAAYTTLSLAMMGEALDRSAKQRQGRRMGLYRGLGSLAFAAGSVAGGRVAEAYGLADSFLICAAAYLLAALVALQLQDQPAAPLAQQPVPSSAPRTRARLLPAAFLTGVFLWTAAHSASASMWPNYMAQLGYSTGQLTSLWGLAALVEMPAMFALGALSDIAGRTAVLMTGGFGIALVNAGYAAAAHLLPVLIGIQVVRGIGFAAYTGSAMTFTTEHGGKERGGASGLYHTTGSAGQLAGLLMGGTLAQTMGFPTMFAACALLALAATAGFWALHHRTPHLIPVATAAQAERKP
ncbi:MAG: MFS transporter [Caldilineaceae bacterium]|nr:MFS transporter [Caldilineaceae bacterium]